MIERAKVLYKKGNKAIVTLQLKEACSHCSSRVICHLSQEGLRQMEIENKIEAEEGDLVEVEIPAPHIVKKSFLLYFLPAIFFLVSTSFSLLRGLSELISLGIGFLCLVGTFFILSVIDKNNFRKRGLEPRIVKIFKEGDAN